MQGEKAELHNTVERLNRQRLVELNEHTQELIKQQRKINVSDEPITKLKSDLKNNNEKNSRAVNQLLSENSDLMKKVEENRSKRKELKRKIKGLKEDWSDLNKKLYEKCDFDVSIKGERYNVYSDDIRKTVISLACNYGVAASNVKKVIEAVAQNIFKYTFEDNLPSTQLF